MWQFFRVRLSRKSRSPTEMVEEDERLVEPAPEKGDGSQHFAACREYAFQAGAFVIGVSGILGYENIGEKFGFLRDNPRMDYRWAQGGSVVVAPSNAYLLGPQYGKEEVIYTDCYADQIRVAKVMYDVLGHYRRWDIARGRYGNARPETLFLPLDPVLVEELIAKVPRLAEKYDVDEKRVTALLAELLLPHTGTNMPVSDWEKK